MSVKSVRKYNNSYPEIAPSVYVDDSAVIIGKVSIAQDVSVWPMAVIRGDVESIRIGEGTNVQDSSVLHVSHANPFSEHAYPLNIGKGVTIGHKTILHGCTVGDYCLIGMGAIVMDGAVLEDYVFVGAGSLVPPGKILESGFLYVGSPVKQIRPLTPSEKESLVYSYQHYIELKNEYLVMQTDLTDVI